MSITCVSIHLYLTALGNWCISSNIYDIKIKEIILLAKTFRSKTAHLYFFWPKFPCTILMTEKEFISIILQTKLKVYISEDLQINNDHQDTMKIKSVGENGLFVLVDGNCYFVVKSVDHWHYCSQLFCGFLVFGIIIKLIIAWFWHIEFC